MTNKEKLSWLFAALVSCCEINNFTQAYTILKNILRFPARDLLEILSSGDANVDAFFKNDSYVKNVDAVNMSCLSYTKNMAETYS
ncbi:MAG: hypothetical protein LBQ97_02465 [Fusobacteriaceae bacterium]|nr:hypothetical protein [Fusobacteriaceae bacterium]